MKTLIIVAAMLASTSAYTAPKGGWFLLFDTQFCDVHECGGPLEEYVHRDTYTTRKQCLAAGRQLIADKTAFPYTLKYDAVGKVSPRCEWSIIY